MTREEARDEILLIESPNILCELPTSFGKTKVALDLMQMRFPTIEYTVDTKILVVIPRVVLIDNWKDEFKKWGYERYLPYVEFVTYVSLPKKAGSWDMVIFDEVHHLSARCREALESFTIRNSVMLSATVGRDMKKELKVLFPDLYIYKVSTKQAIQEEILPDPRVYLIPLTLDNVHPNYKIIKNKSQKVELVIPYAQRFNYAKVKNRRIVIKCTQRQYYDDMSAMIAWYKNKMFNEVFKNLFLRKSGERLRWLSEQKSSFVRHLLDQLDGQRTLTFCNGIPQTEELGKYCINSKNKASEENLHKFNEGKVDHITACNMLDEGMNLVNCRVGVYAVLNSSERMIKQKLGRLLRHSDPVIIIPYFKGTRDEEIVGKMLEDYNPELVSTITNLTELQL
jgi:superfamily II DNA or RNA helicase